MPIIKGANVLCNCVLRMHSVHHKGFAVCVGFTIDPAEAFPSYDVVHLCFLKDVVNDGSNKIPEKCDPFMASATPEEARAIANKLIFASELWENEIKRKKKQIEEGTI